VIYKNIPVKECDYIKIKQVKALLEKDFDTTFSWSSFMILLATSYCVGKAVFMNEDKYTLQVGSIEED
jgi:hypothetical protein